MSAWFQREKEARDLRINSKSMGLRLEWQKCGGNSGTGMVGDSVEVRVALDNIRSGHACLVSCRAAIRILLV